MKRAATVTVAVAVLLVVGVGLLRSRPSSPPRLVGDGQASTRQTVGDPNLEVALLRDGLPAELASLFANVETTVLMNDGASVRIRQVNPSVGVSRESQVTLALDQILPPNAYGPLRTTAGFDVYQVERTVTSTTRGTEQRLTYFFPYSELPPEILTQLGVARSQQPRSAGELRIGFRSATQTGGLGALVSAVLTSSGNTATRAPGSPPLGTDTTVPGAAAERYTLSEADLAYMRETNELIRSSKLDQQACQAADRASYLEQLWASRNAEAQAKAQAKIDAELAHSSQHNPAGKAVAVVAGGYEIMHTIADWFCDSSELDALDDCQQNPTNPLTQSATPGERQNAARAISDARGDVNAITAARVGLTGVTTAGSLTVGGNAGLGMDLLSIGAGASLAEAQRARMVGVRGSVVRCGPNWVSATLLYSKSLAFKNEPPQRGLSNDRGTVTERADGTVLLAIDARGAIVESRGGGTWRSTEDGGWDCIQYHERVDGPTQVKGSGRATGLGAVDLGGGRQAPAQLFTLTINANGEKLHEVWTGTRLSDKAINLKTDCEPEDSLDNYNGAGATLCVFDDVPLLVGGRFDDNNSYASRDDPNNIEIRSCVIEVRPTTPPTPTPTPAPPPSGCGPGRRC